MKREILFRGKIMNGDRWIYGSLDDESCINQMIRFHMPDDGVGESHKYLVDEETVGQFTGLYDNNGTKIFEGDIVKVSIEYDCGCYPHSKIETRQVKNLWDVYMWNGNIIEVIGNIYDNKELLGE